jgi:hypothetical protein
MTSTAATHTLFQQELLYLSNADIERTHGVRGDVLIDIQAIAVAVGDARLLSVTQYLSEHSANPSVPTGFLLLVERPVA